MGIATTPEVIAISKKEIDLQFEGVNL